MATPDIATLLANTIRNNQNNYGPIPSSAIKPNSQVNLGIPKQDTTNYAGITGGVSDSLINEYTNLNNQLNSQQELQQKSGQSIVDIMSSLTGKTADQQQANELTGVNTETANLTKYAEQLAGLNSQASILNREAQAVPLQVQENNRNTGATDRGVAPQEAGALRLNALKALSIAQQSDIAAAAATGSQLRLQAAKDKAQQIVDLKYKPLEDALAIKKQQYELNKDLLSSIDKKRTEALDIALKREERNYNDTKAIATEAAKNGAPLGVIDAITKAKDFKEAISASGEYLKTPNTDIIKLDNGTTMLIDKNTGKVIKNFGGVKATGGSVTNSFAISENMLKTNFNNDAVGLISNVIKSSKAKPNQAMTDAINVIAGVQQFVKDAPSGVFKGLAPIRLLPGKAKSAEALTNLSNIEAINLKVQQWASGASLTEQQTKSVEKMTPRKGDTDKQIKAKVNALANYMVSQVSGQLAGQGISFTSEKVDYFAPSSQDKLTELYKNPTKAAQIEQAVQMYPDATADEILQIIE
mgnify:CR=1 FL=1